jgi:hypothetical protein
MRDGVIAMFELTIERNSQRGFTTYSAR